MAIIKKNQRTKIHILILVNLIILFLANGCVVEPDRPSIEALFSPTPTFTSTPTTIWFPATATPTRAALTTATPNPAAEPKISSVIFRDPLTAEDSWRSSNEVNGNISVKNGSIILSVQKPRGLLTTFRTDTSIKDYYFESSLNVGLCKQDDQLGVLFRTEGPQSYYRLLINCQGMISLQRVIGGTPTILQDWTPSNQVQPGLNSQIKIGIWVNGKILRVYLNDQLQFETENDTFREGGIGFFAKAAGDTVVTARFSAISVYKTVN